MTAADRREAGHAGPSYGVTERAVVRPSIIPLTNTPVFEGRSATRVQRVGCMPKRYFLVIVS